MPVKPWGTGPGHRSLRRGRWSLPHHAYLITTVTHERNPIFRDLCVARILIHEMRYHEQSGWLRSLAWVVMPDHLHWLFILERSCSLAQLIKSLKGDRPAASMGACGAVVVSGNRASMITVCAMTKTCGCWRDTWWPTRCGPDWLRGWRSIPIGMLSGWIDRE